MRSPVKYSRWIQEAPEGAEDHIRYDGNPMIALATVVVIVGAVFGLIALVAEKLCL